MARRRQHRGFTLIELVLVMLLVALVMAAAAPSLGSWGRGRKLVNATDDVLATTRWARSQAISTGQPHRVEFNEEDASFTVTRQEGGAWEPVDGEFGQTRTLEATIRLEVDRSDGGGTVIDLWPNGRVSPLTITFTAEWGDEAVLASPGAAEPLRRVENQER